MIRETVSTLLASTAVAVLVYFIVVNGAYVCLHVAGLFELRDDLRDRRWGPMYDQFASPFLPGIAVVVPAYDEASVIVDNVQSLLNVNYPDVEVVVVNDGSTDGTLDRLREAYDLAEIDADPPVSLPTEPVRAIYRSRDAIDLTVVDKENGGRADALNAGIALTDQRLFCTVDADSIIDPDGLLQVVQPFLEHPEETVASGGTVRVVNGCTVEDGAVTRVDLPTGLLARLQVPEYLRAFYSGRLGYDRFGGTLLLSGAFGVFRTDIVREIGGFATDNITEDFELVMGLHEHLTDAGREHRISFVPDPIVWTEVPTTAAALRNQRSRWYRGLIQTLRHYRHMIGNPAYGRPGWLVLPLFVLAELLGPLVEGFGYALVGLGLAFGLVSVEFAAAYFLLAVGIGVVLSWLSIYSEVWGYRRYDRPRQQVSLLAASVVENLGFRQWKAFVKWRALIGYLRGDDSWGTMVRSGFNE